VEASESNLKELHTKKLVEDDKIDRDLYELRVEFAWNNVRVLYAYMFRDYIVLLHGLTKKTDKIPENDKEKARIRMLDFQVRYNKGKIKLNRI